MDVLVTPDVLNRLAISSCSILNSGTKTPYVLFAFSKTNILFISSDKQSDFSKSVCAHLRTSTETIELPLVFETLVQTSSNHWIISFAYEFEKITFPLKDTWQYLLTIHQFQQLRKDVRVHITKNITEEIKIENMESELWIHGVGKKCALQNISFSGARLISTDNFELEGDDKLVLKFQFSSPSEIATVRAVVLRKKILQFDGISCIDIAVRFFDPVDLVLLSRLTQFFLSHPDVK